VPRKKKIRLPVLPSKGYTIPIRRMSMTALARGRVEHPEMHARPRTRADCIDGPRPCPFVGCRYHLAIDVHPSRGSIKTNFPRDSAEGLRERAAARDVPLDDIVVDMLLRSLEEMPETCCLDVADRGAHTLEEVGAMMNLTRERVRQIEEIAMRAARDGGDLDAHREDL
jgi:hypothetical protein